MSWDRHRGHATGYDVVATGFNYRLDEMRAAIGLVQLSRLEAGNTARARLAARYRHRLHDVAGLTMPPADDARHDGSAHHLAAVVLPPGADRQGIRAELQARGIQTSVHYPPIHRFSAYRDLPGRPLPRTDALAERLLTLPLFPHLREDQVDDVADALLLTLRGSRTAGPGPARRHEGARA
jgi:dTDP-4-amino-4,6-dideoxygalactose transaminase